MLDFMVGQAVRWIGVGLMVWGLLTLALGCAGGGGDEAGPATVSGQEREWQQIDEQVRDRAHSVGPKHILLVGDSLTWFNPLTELCGLPVVNAGYPGGKWDSILTRRVFTEFDSEIAIVMLGTNNGSRGPAVGEDQMVGWLNNIRTARLIVETPPYNFLPEEMTPEHLQILLDIQARVMALTGETIDSRPVMGDPTLYRDGVHWNERGYVVQNGLLQSAACKEVS